MSAYRLVLSRAAAVTKVLFPAIAFFTVSIAATHVEAAAAPLPYSALSWRSIGPAISGGRVTAVVGIDSNPFLYYAGSAGGGVYKTIDGGAHWQAVFDGQPVGPIGAIAIAPGNGNEVWVGTGEANPRNDVSYGDGIYHSIDGGKTWQHVDLHGTSQIAKIIVDPQNVNVVIVAALGDPFKDSSDRGVFRTADGGKTWTKTLYVGLRSGASDLAIDPKNPNTLYAGIWQYSRAAWDLESGGPDDGLYKSADNGLTWTKLTGHGLPDGPTGRIGVAIAPSNPQRIYAIIQSKAGIIWRSSDGGATWQLASSDTEANQRPFYYSHPYVDPTNPDHLFAVSVDLVESKDGAKTWTVDDQAVHGDHHDIWWAADGERIINGNDGGVAISQDAGSTWEWRNNIAIGQVYHVGYSRQVPYQICGGLQDNASWCAPSVGAWGGSILDRDWVSVGGGDGTWVLPDPSDPDLIWNASGGGNSAGELAIFDMRSHQSWEVSPYERDTNAREIATLPYRFNWESPLAFSPQDPRVAYYGGNVLWRSVDRGFHWTAISPDLTRNVKAHQQISGGAITADVSGAEFSDTILSVAPSSIEPGLIWIGTDDGLVQLTRDGGRHWSNVSIPGPGPWGRIDAIDVSHSTRGSAYAVVDRHFEGDRRPYVYTTADYGKTWRSVAGNLPSDQFVHVVRQDPFNADVLYAGLEQSIWVSFDGGASWRSLQLNLPAASVRDIQVQPDFDDLLIGTHGRSFWILDDVAALQGLSTAQATSAPTFFRARTAYLFAQSSYEPTNGGSSAFEGADPDYGALLTYYQSAAAGASPAIQITGPGGRIVRTISGTHDQDGKHVPNVPNGAGVNRVAWDLTSDAPVKWNSAPKWNRGPSSGPEVIPGTYTARLTLGGREFTQAIDVKADPRAPWSQRDYVERRAFLNMLYGDFSAVDADLNSLDALQARLNDRRKASAGNAALAAKIDTVQTALLAVRAAFTSNPQGDQDDDFLQDMLRERLQSIMQSMSGSFQPPTAALSSEGAVLHALFIADDDAYKSFLRGDVGTLNSALVAAKLAPVKP
ncbi:MAG TPA: hypothetical protein VJN22_01790 [Candidatus Eremiobacteraceae bacterium]|nr:hypothetical protein [Candidatus Eremiobacteraceae bacterium]